MPLSSEQAVEQAHIIQGFALGERTQLDTVRRYWRARQKLPAVIPSGAKNEIKVMARSSRVNVMPIVVNSLVQSMFVDSYVGAGKRNDKRLWGVWQANKMDAHQTAIHRATAAYGAAYSVVLPGDPVPVIRGASPRSMTAIYGEDPHWPLWALERLGPVRGKGLWRLYDDEAIYYLSGGATVSDPSGSFVYVETREHGAGVTPVVRHLDEDDLDADDEVELEAPTYSQGYDLPVHGQVAPLMPLQDQIDLTTFGLQIAQHFGAFRQRYIIGWVAENEAEAMKASASQFWQFDEDANEVKIGEFEQTDLSGYIESREASLRHAASLSQTPVHELIGELVNLSAEALAAAEAGKDRKVNERQALSGESHEQELWLAGRYMGIKVPDDAQVKWRDTSARSFAATVDALGKLSISLGIPAEELWERIPGVTQQDVSRWKESGAIPPAPPPTPPSE